MAQFRYERSYEQEYYPSKNPKPAEPMKGFPCKDYCCVGATPGGTDNRHMWDEKAGLDRIVMDEAAEATHGYMPSNHDSQKQGIYKTNSVGDYD